MKVGSDHETPASPCTNCGKILDAATGVTEGNDDTVPSRHQKCFTVCIKCGHVMTFDGDLRLRDLTDEERIDIAGDKRLVAIQWARAVVVRDRAYCEDFVREMIKRKRGKSYQPTHEMINGLVDKLLASVPP